MDQPTLFGPPTGEVVKVITIQQPYAHYCIHGDSIAAFGITVDPDIKNVENRNWYSAYRGRLYIHAGKTWYIDAEDRRDLRQAFPEIYQTMTSQMGHIIGHVQMTGCVQSHPWFFGDYGFVFTQPTPIKHLPAKGSLGLWNYTMEQAS